MPPAVQPGDDLGSLRGFERFHRDYFGYVWAVLAHLGVPDASIDDAHQEVFLTCFRRRDAFRPGHPVKPWLVGIARRVAFRHRRSQQRGLRKLSAIAAQGPVTGGDPQRQLEARILLERFVAALDPPRREAFILAEIEGHTGREIADMLGIHVDAAYSRVRQARVALTRELVRIDERPVAPSRVSHCFALLLPELKGAGGGAATWASALALKTKDMIVFTALAGGVAIAVAAPPAPAGVVAAERPANATSARSGRGDHGGATRHTAADESAGADAEVRIVAAEPGPGRVRRVAEKPAPSDMRSGAVASAPAAAAPGADGGAPAPSPASLGEEARLLARAQQALGAGSPAEALLHLDAHAKAFPSGSLIDARTALRIEGLCALGQISQARREATDFLRERPDSGVARKVAESCAHE